MIEGADRREEAIRELFPLVKKIARRVQRMIPAAELDDLVGEGCVGLIRAVDTYDPTRGPALEHYAARVVAGAMLNGLRRWDPVSERVRREVRIAERERYAIAARTGSLPSPQEMEKHRPLLRRARMHAYRYAPLSLDSPLPIGESIPGDVGCDPASIAAARLEGEGVRAALHLLPPRQRRVLALHYFGGRTLHQIGEELCVSPQRTSQLHKAALKRLRSVLHAAT